MSGGRRGMAEWYAWRLAASAFSVLCVAGTAQAKGILTQGGSNIAPVASTIAANLVGAQQAAAMAAQSQNNLSRMTLALRAMQTMQSAARSITLAAPGGVPNGLQLGGLVPDSGLAAPGVANPVTDWTGAKTPTQTVAAGRTTVTVKQTASKAILSWNSFNIGRDTTLSFAQGDASWVALNQIGGGTPSQIEGAIKAPGQVYLINPNGIIFTGASQVNVGALIASTASLGNSQFLANGIYSTSTVASTTVYAPSFTNAGGAVTVQAGAQIATATPATITSGGGFVMLLGTQVSNVGTITTPDGQTALAAGDSFRVRPGYGSVTNSTSTTRGNEIAVTLKHQGSSAAPGGSGLVSNDGLITAATGDITLVGEKVVQNGVLLSTTSVDTRGTIHLLTSATDPHGNVTLTADSFMDIAPELGSTATALNSQRAGLIADSAVQDGLRAKAADPDFNDLSQLDDREDESRVEIVSGGNVEFQGGSDTLTNGGQVAVSAVRRVQVDTGATIDVSGSYGVALPVADNDIAVSVQGNELRDNPQNRETGNLGSQTVYVDTRDLSVVPASAGDTAERDYTSGGVLEVSGYLNTTGHTIGEWTALGGSIMLATGTKGAVVAQSGAILNIAGGALQYQGGAVNQSYLVGANGQIYNVNDAPADITYTGVYAGFVVNHANWGAAETYGGGLHTPSVVYEQGYTEGRDAGTLTLATPTSVFDGTIQAGVVNGLLQTVAAPGTTADPYTLNQDVVAEPGTLTLADQTGGNVTPTSTKVNFGAGPSATAATLSVTSRLPAQLVGTSLFDAAALSADGLGGLSVAADGAVSVTAPLRFAAGANVSLFGASVAIGSDITAPSGTVTIGNIDDAGGTPIVLQARKSGRLSTGNVTLARGAVIDTAGLWTNLALGDADLANAAFINGGAVTLTSVKSLVLDKDSLIDSSAGAVIAANGARTGGAGGNITLVAGAPAANLKGGDLVLQGSFQSIGFTKGGVLSLTAPSFRIRATLPQKPEPGVLALDPAFFRQGFSAYDLNTTGNVAVDPGTIVNVVEPVYQFTAASEVLPSGAPVAAGASLTLNPVYLANPTLTKVTQRPGPSFSAIISLNSFAPKPTLSGIEIGLGAAINVDPGQTIHLESQGQLTVNGDLSAPGGKIDLWSDEFSADAANAHGKLTSIWLGGQSLVDADAAGFTASDAAGDSIGIAPAGGTITIGSSNTLAGTVNSTEAAIIMRKGAIIEASGAAALDRVTAKTQLNLLAASPPADRTILLAGAGGTISLSSECGIYLNGSLRAATGGPGAAGGTLFLGLETDAAEYDNQFEAVPRILTITQDSGAALLPAHLAPGETNAALTPGTGRISADEITAGGFGTVSLLARDAFRFVGNVDLRASQAIELYRGAIVDTNPRDSVTLAAPYVLLSGQTPVTAAFSELVPAVTGYSAQNATGKFTVDADLIDVQNSLNFGGVETTVNKNGAITKKDLAGFRSINLDSAGDIRFIGATSDPGVSAPPTTLITTADLNLTAREVYTTSVAVVIAGFDPAADGANGTFNPQRYLTISRTSGTTATAPLNLGGNLTFLAPDIRQGGVVWQPLGDITFGNVSTFIGDSLPGTADARATVSLLPGSLTSVSAAGLTIPYGGTTDGVNYSVNGLPVVGVVRNLNFGLAGVSNGVSPGVITIAALKTSIAAGAKLDLSGGGVLSGEGFISGEGGSTDLLTTPFLSVGASGGVTQPSLASDPVYAIVAGAQPDEAPAQSFTQTGDADSTPALGEQITIPAGIAGLPAGRYTLLPAAYALTPGGYRVEIDGAASLAAPSLVALPNGSYAIASTTDIVNTAVQGTAPLAITITPAAQLRLDADYDEESYSSFLVSRAALIGAIRPVLPEDAGTLAFQLPANNNVSIRNAGETLFQPATGGIGGTLEISGAAFVASPNFDIYGTTRKRRLGAATVSLSAAAIDAFDPFLLEIGRAGTGGQAYANGITLETGATLRAARVVLTALNKGITLHDGSEIDTLGLGTIPFDSTTRGKFDDGGASVLDVGNGYFSYDTANSGTSGYGPVAVDDGATIYTDGSIAFSTQAAVKIGVNAVYGGRYLDLAVPEINIGDAAALGATAPSGLTLTAGVLNALTAGVPGSGVPAVQVLVLSASKSLNFFGDTALDLGGTNVQLVIDSPAIYGYGAAADTATISAGTIVWNGTSTTDALGNDITALPGGVVANGPGTGQGTLNLDAGTILFGYSNLDLPLEGVSLNRLMLGFGTVNLNARTDVTANNRGTLAVYQSQTSYGAPGSGGVLNINTPTLTTASAASIGFAAGAAINIAPDTATAAILPQAAGGEIDLTGGTVNIGGTILLPSGRLDVQAQGDIGFGATSQVDLAGLTTTVFDKTTYGFGGDLLAESAAGNVTQSAGSTIDVSAAANNAGTVVLTATNAAAGQVLLDGTLRGAANVGYDSGVFNVRAQTLPDFAALNNTLDTGGFFQTRSFDIKQGDLTIGNGVTAHEIDVSLDGGSLTVNGLLDASGGGFGTINLAAADNLTLAGNAVLDAHGTSLVVDSYGQPIAAENAPTISLTTSNGELDLATGATINLASADGVSRGDLELNVPRLGAGDADIAAAGPVNIAGAATIAVNAFATYHGLADPTGTASGAPDALITQAYLDQINTDDTLPFMAAAATNANLASRLAGLSANGAKFHFRPGVQIVSATPDGDLTVQGDIDLAGYRYGPGVNPNIYGSGEPGVLSIRAGGDLNIYGSITDGFAKPISDAGTNYANGWVLYSGTEPYGQNIVVPAAVILAKGSILAQGTTINYNVPITGGDFAAGSIAPVALTVAGRQTTTVAFIATSDITAASGKLLFKAGTLVPAQTSLPGGAVIGAGGTLPFDLNVGQVVWPANTPFTVLANVSSPSGQSGVELSQSLTLLPGALIPGGSFIKFAAGQAGVSRPTGPDGAAVYTFTDGDPVSATFGTRPVGADGTQGPLYPLAQLLPVGDMSWSINLVGGADTAAADPRIVQAASALTRAGVAGDVTLADTHYFNGAYKLQTIPPQLNPHNHKNHAACEKFPARCMPTYQAISQTVLPAFSVIRTGTGSLNLLAGGSVNEDSDYGVYTAGAQAAPILNAAGADPYNLPQGRPGAAGTLLGAGANALATAALAANYQANYPVGGGNVLVAAQGDLNGFISTQNTPTNTDLNSIDLTDTDAIGAWLWRQGGAGQPAAWWVEFGALESTPGGPFAPQIDGFQGIGTLGGGNLTVAAGGSASGLNLAVAATGRVQANNTLAQTGGGQLEVKIGAGLNYNGEVLLNSRYDQAAGDAGGLISDLRGNILLTAGSIGAITPNYIVGNALSTTEPNDPRATAPTFTATAVTGAGIDLAPGDSSVSVNTRGDLVIDGAGNPGLAQNLVDTTPVAASPGGTKKNYVAGGTSTFSLWTAATSLSLFAAGGDVAPSQHDLAGNGAVDVFSGANVYPSILSAIAQNGDIDFAGGQVELAPAAAGQLDLLAEGSIFGGATGSASIISMSGADPAVAEATPFDPAIAVGGPGAGQASFTNVSPNANSQLLAFGPDTPTDALHAPGGQPAAIYAGAGDIIDLQFGQIQDQINLKPTIWYIAAEPFDVRAGRDIVASGSPTATTTQFSTSPSVFLNLSPTDISSVTAGRDIIESSMDIAGPGTLLVQAGRNLYQADQGTIDSIGPLFDIDPNDRDSGATLSVLAGVGAAGPDYANFASLFLNSRGDLELENAARIVQANDATLVSWLQDRYGYAGTPADAYKTFLLLPADQQDVFLRQLYFEELNASGLEFNNPDSVRAHSYLRGRDAIAALFPTGTQTPYAGDITLFGDSGIHTNFGGTIQTLTPGGQTLIGVEGTTPPGTAGLITQGSGDIDIYALGSVSLGESRILTTFGGNIVIWTAMGNIDAGRGSKTTVVYTPVQRVYDNYGNISLSPSVPSTGAGIATLNPIPGIVPGDIDLVAPLGTVDAGEAGIRVSGNLNIAALHVVNAANISVQGTTTGVPHVSAPNVGALTSASSASGAAALAAEGAAGNNRDNTPLPSIWIVEVLGYGGGPADGVTPKGPRRLRH